MSFGLKLRLAVFVSAIALMIGLGGWTAHTSWARIHEMRQRLTAAQSQSFFFADHFQQAVLALNNLVLRQEIHHDPSLWQQFRRTREELNRWIVGEAALWTTAPEQAISARLQEAYRAYLRAARQLAGPAAAAGRSSVDAMTGLAQFEARSEALLGLAYELANAHRRALNLFLQRSDRSLAHLQFVLWGSLVLLLVCGSGLAAVVYRELIAPLQLRLVESRQLMGRQEKLASLGLLAAGVAHEIRNPLTAMKARLFALQRLLDRDSPEQADAEVIGQEIQRLERIVRDFLLFARPAEPAFRLLPAEQPLRQVQTLLASQLAQTNITLTLEAGPAAAVRVDPNQLEQVLINLVQNAADSIQRDGTITLRIRKDRKRLHDQVREVVILEVADTGKGIPADVQKRLFDPFFTTKATGTGLGLSIALQTVEKQGGTLQYQTEHGRGTTFGIVLPAGAEAASGAPPASGPEEIARSAA